MAGFIYENSGTTAIGTTTTIIDFDTATENGETFYSAGSPSRATIPASLNGKFMTFWVQYADDASDPTHLYCELLKNGVVETAATVKQSLFGLAVCFPAIAVATDDYFQVNMVNFDAAITAPAGECLFSGFTQERCGLVNAYVNASQPISITPTQLTFQTAELDTEATQSGNSFIVPDRVTRAAVSLNSYSTSNLAQYAVRIDVRMNGTSIRYGGTGGSHRCRGGDLAPVAVTPGQALTIYVESDIITTLDSTYTSISIEWLA